MVLQEKKLALHATKLEPLKVPHCANFKIFIFQPRTINYPNLFLLPAQIDVLL